MIFTRPMFAVACSLFISLSIAACAKATTGPIDDGSGGDDSWGANSSSKASSGTGTGGGTATGTGGSGGGVPPTPTTTCEINSTDCSTCQDCSRSTANGGQCESYVTACVNDSECLAYDTCHADCAGDTTCIDNCGTAHPSGQTLWLDYASCVICTDCYARCDGPTACTTP